MNRLEEKILKTIKKNNLIEKGDKIVLGVSGGPDSMCMLNALINITKVYGDVEFIKQAHSEAQNSNNEKENYKEASLPMAQERDIEKENCQNAPFPVAKNCQNAPSPMAKIVVCHVNHMIRDEAKADEEYVKKYCEENNIEFYSKSIDVQKFANNSKIGTEEAGRNIRYEFFEEILQKTNANKIAIAHNKNDKVETMIMNMLRGSGISGLKGIEAKRGKFIRPLIECERAEIEEYCREKNLKPRIDKTNFENEYTRNKIRNIVIPYIKKEFNPNIIETFDRLSKLVVEEENYIENEVAKVYGNMVLEEKQDEIVVDLKKFNTQQKVIKSRVLLYTITRLFGSTKGIEKVHIEDVIKLCENNIGNKYLTPNKNLKVLVKNHKIYFLKLI